MKHPPISRFLSLFLTILFVLPLLIVHANAATPSQVWLEPPTGFTKASGARQTSDTLWLEPPTGFTKASGAKLTSDTLWLEPPTGFIKASGTKQASDTLWLEPPTGFTRASDVDYVTSNGIVANWGVRGEPATFLTTYAEDYYTGKYTYESLIANPGNANTRNTPSSKLYKVLSDMMNAKSTSTTSYGGTRDLFKYTDCMANDPTHISSFYSGVKLNGKWDGAQTWNREHTWPNSKIDDVQENDIMMLRPSCVSENSDRGNTAYGKTSGFYDPNSQSNGQFNLHGDCARILLYVYVRWGVTDTMWGYNGVIEDCNVLLEWMEEDPVDTWEMGRNDAVQSITGVRNVFVDYPELSWLLFDQKIPANYVSPSGADSGIGQDNNDVHSAVVTNPTDTSSAGNSSSVVTDSTTTSSAGNSSSIVTDSTTTSPDSNDSVSDAPAPAEQESAGNSIDNANAHLLSPPPDALTEGDYLIISDGRALKASTTMSSKRLDYADVKEEDLITFDDPSLIFHIGKYGDYWTIFNEASGLYVGGKGTKNQAGLFKSVGDNTLWTVTMRGGKFEFINKGNEGASVNANLRCNGEYGWGCYSTSTGTALSLYKTEGKSTEQEHEVLLQSEGGTTPNEDGAVTPTAAAADTSAGASANTSDNNNILLWGLLAALALLAGRKAAGV